MCSIDCPDAGFPCGCDKPWDVEYEAPGVFGERGWHRRGDLMAGKTSVWVPERRAEVEAAVRASRTRGEAADRLGVSVASLAGACLVYRLSPAELLGSAAPPPGGVVASGLSPNPGAGAPPEPFYPGAGAGAEPDIGEKYIPPPVPIVPVGKELTVVLAGDFHVPDHDRPAVAAFCRYLNDRQPDVIFLNEVGEWESMTKYGGNWGVTFEDDVRHTRSLLVQIRSICPKARIVLKQTNHDTRFERRVRELMPQMHGYFSIRKELKLDDLGIEWVPEHVVWRIGRLKVIHGHELSNSPKGMVPENSGKRALQRFGEPGWTVVYFHTHRRGYWEERHDTGTLRAVNLPCLRTLWPDWTKPAPTGWSHGFGVAHIGPAGQTNLYTVDIENGAFVYGGTRYAAAA